MEHLLMNNPFDYHSNSKKDVLSAFKEKSEKNLTIRAGMSVNEISEVVSEKIINLINEQFEATKAQLEEKE
jgi:hypothetical protein